MIQRIGGRVNPGRERWVYDALLFYNGKIGRSKIVDIPNSLFNCDCLTLAERLPSKSIDLVYLDPPWNSPSEFEYIADENITADTNKSDSYIDFFVNRLTHFYRVLKNTGSLFIHLDPVSSTSIKEILNKVFGEKNYRNQYILPRNMARVNINFPYFDYTEILFYSKTENFEYTPIIRPFSDEEIQKSYSAHDEKGYYRLKSLISINQNGPRFEWMGITPDKGYAWRASKQRLDELFSEGLISLDVSRKLPRLKKYIDPGIPIGSIWNDLQPTLTPRESTGIFSQQSSELLSRIIKIATKEGAVVFDPFCGSATALISAEMMKRRWIGCDIAQNVYQLALARIQDQLGVIPGKDFKYGDNKSVVSYFRRVYKSHQVEISSKSSSDLQPYSHIVSEKVELREEYYPKPEKIVPLVITEGKTDWKHLKAAYERLKNYGLLPQNSVIEFHEFEDNLEMGDDKLLKMCENYSITTQLRKYIFIFDRDKAETVKKVNSPAKAFKNWGNSVYSFAIPVPSHRENTPEISIEFYYPDEDLIRKDINGRRLFLTSEFNKRTGRHIEEPLICPELSRLTGIIKILDTAVYDNKNINVALPKNDFANSILHATDSFSDVNVYEFTKIFEIIDQISSEE